jgi:hypothetical protein
MYARFFRRGPMNWNKWIRQIHRWLAITFTVAVITNIAVMGQEELALWVGLLTLLPLALLLFTGLYMFVLPYASKRRGGQSTD